MIDLTTAQALIHENMPVVCSQNGQFAVVDHLEGQAAIKLNKDDTGQHHYIPLAWVTSIDDKVHVDRTGDEAMKAWATSPSDISSSPDGEIGGEISGEIGGLSAAQTAPQADLPPPVVNSVDATMGQPLVDRVMIRKTELEEALALVPETDIRGREPIELALSTIAGLLTGDLKNVPAVVASDMNLWLERNKHLAERAVDPMTGKPAPLPDEAKVQQQQAQQDPPTPPIADAVAGPWVGKPAETPTA
jgi:hypothetical protein